MDSQEKLSPKIIFLNQPKLSEHEVDKKFNERRLALLPKIEDFLSGYELFKDKEVSVSFAHTGISSLICIIWTIEGKMVLKIPLSLADSKGEAEFLEIWEKAGVKVPHVTEAGTLGDHTFTLMEFIDAPTIADAYSSEEMVEKGIYRQMGSTLRAMHVPEAKGYGRYVDGKAEYESYSDLVKGPDMEKRISYVEEHNLLTEEHGSLDRAFSILAEHCEAAGRSSYCHDDFGTTNIFATEPLTVFDPNPRLNDGYLDLGRSVGNHILSGIYPKELIEGYFDGEPYDEKVLHAAILVNAMMKFPYSHKTKKTAGIERMQKYLRENKRLLE